MKLLKEFRLIFIFLFVILALIGYRTLRPSGFKYDARKLAEDSFNGTNVVNEEEMARMEGEKLVLDLDRTYNPDANSGTQTLAIGPDSVLHEAVLRRLKKNRGPVIVYSSDEGKAARVWMVLAQTGFRQLYILLPHDSTEADKSEFRSDTMTGPEL